MDEVQNKWDTLKLNDDIWAKLIYFEQNRRLAKAYVSAPVLTIDGSTNGLDGFRIGLSGIDNSYRNLESVGCLRSIGQGVKLKIDSQGNILIRKISHNAAKCSVWIRDWPTKKVDENCMMREIEQSDISYKLFDMRKFRHHLERRRRQVIATGDQSTVIDWRQCVSIISFIRKTTGEPNDILEDPCWIMLINIIAIDMIKSIICDNRDQQSVNADLAAPLARHHALMNKSSHEEPSKPHPANLRTSSSTSVLCEPEALAAATATGSGPSFNGYLPRSADKMIVDVTNAGKVKKARTINPTRNRPLNADNHREYRSSQQLSSNNIIYTTFSSKFMNTSPRSPAHQHHSGDLVTSDYYSASRSSNGGHNSDNSSRNRTSGYSASSLQSCSRIAPRNLPPLSSASKRPSGIGGRVPFARGEFVRQLEHNRSQSSFDLTLTQHGHAKKPVRSAAIRMNYDHFSEGEDFDVGDEQELGGSRAEFNHGSRSTSMRSIDSNKTRNEIAAKAANDQTSGASPYSSSEKKTGQVNHNECQAMHNSHGLAGAIVDAASQKLSKSSLTSSSSSGCADNDYFISHSSSSMSTTSNERDLSSQPASSSGIACSDHNSTSDEYDDRKQSVSPDAGSALSSDPSQRSAGPTGNDTKLPPTTGAPKARPNSSRRGYKIKTIEAERDFADQDCGIVCDCEPPTAGYDCDCCCDCLIEDHPGPTFGQLDCCDCDTESIYDCLPAPKSLVSPRKKSAGKSDERTVQSSGSNENRDIIRSYTNVSTTMKASTTFQSDTSEKNDGKLSMANKSPSSACSSSSTSSSSPGWLEKRKYSRIFPKFIFSSSNSSSRRITGATGDKANNQKKSKTLDREEKFRLTRSTHDLA